MLSNSFIRTILHNQQKFVGRTVNHCAGAGIQTYQKALSQKSLFNSENMHTRLLLRPSSSSKNLINMMRVIDSAPIQYLFQYKKSTDQILKIYTYSNIITRCPSKYPINIIIGNQKIEGRPLYYHHSVALLLARHNRFISKKSPPNDDHLPHDHLLRPNHKTTNKKLVQDKSPAQKP